MSFLKSESTHINFHSSISNFKKDKDQYDCTQLKQNETSGKKVLKDNNKKASTDIVWYL